MSASLKTYDIAYDCEERKVGCVIIQAAMGGSLPSELFWKHFGDCNSWLVGITPGMRLYPITEEQLPMLVAQTNFDRSK